MGYDIYKEVARLRAKHGKDRSLVRSIPSYKIDQNLPPLSNCMGGGKATKRKANPKPDHLYVDILHKQGPQVISKDHIQYAGGRKV